MVRFWWACVVVGLVFSAFCAFQFFLSYLRDPAANDPVLGFLGVAGFGVGIVVATVAGAMIAKAHGKWIPPI